MPVKKVKLPTSWSYSRWADFCTCPKYYEWKYVLGNKGKSSPAMERGTAIHKLAEDYTGGKLKRLPAELQAFPAEFKELKKRGAEPEASWNFTRRWGLTEWNDWNNVWLRMKVDCHYVLDDTTLVVIDHKTGKMRPHKEEGYRQQLELTAVAGFKVYPHVEVVLPQLWYLDEGVIYPEEPEPVERSAEKKLTKIWENNAERLLKTTRFPAKPGEECRWCTRGVSKGGDCKHG